MHQNRSPGEIADELAVLPRAPSTFLQEFDQSDTLPDLYYPGSGEAPMHERIDIIVDGSGDGHSVALSPDEEVFFSYERGASNNEAEFNAVILALENLPENSERADDNSASRSSFRTMTDDSLCRLSRQASAIYRITTKS